jgi:hypothetical protein
MNSYDSWRNDMLEATIPLDDKVELPRYLVELRDGTAPPPVNQGVARSVRMAKMEANDVKLTDFLADLARYIDHADQAELVGDECGPYMAKFIRDERDRITAKQTKLREELAYLRSIS